MLQFIAGTNALQSLYCFPGLGDLEWFVCNKCTNLSHCCFHWNKCTEMPTALVALSRVKSAQICLTVTFSNCTKVKRVIRSCIKRVELDSTVIVSCKRNHGGRVRMFTDVYGHDRSHATCSRVAAGRWTQPSRSDHQRTSTPAANSSQNDWSMTVYYCNRIKWKKRPRW